MAEVRISQNVLPVLDPNVPHSFKIPSKRINDGDDVSFFLTSTAYRDIWSFIFQLNASVIPRKQSENSSVLCFHLNQTGLKYSPAVSNLRKFLEDLESLIDNAPPDPGPRRFGNVSFRTWYKLVEDSLPKLMAQYIPSHVLNFPQVDNSNATAAEEIKSYLFGSFGSSQRLDYGTGHELSFLAFLACIWKLGGFNVSEYQDEERAIVLIVIER
jgi:serine/threonine-protein phosphatase 2A activator